MQEYTEKALDVRAHNVYFTTEQISNRTWDFRMPPTLHAKLIEATKSPILWKKFWGEYE